MILDNSKKLILSCYTFDLLFFSARSEVRSYDETTIQPQTKSLRSLYDSKSQYMNDVRKNKTKLNFKFIIYIYKNLININ